MNDWRRVRDITSFESKSDSETLRFILWLRKGAIEIELLTNGSANAILIHNAGALGEVDEADNGWRDSGLIVVDTALLQNGFLASLLDYFDASENPLNLGVIGDVHLFTGGPVLLDNNKIEFSHRDSLRIDVGENKPIEIQVFEFKLPELPKIKPSIRDRLGKRPIVETSDNLAGREKWFKKRND